MKDTEIYKEHVSTLRNNFTDSGYKIIKSGIFDSESLLELKMNLSLHEYSEYRELYYENIKDINFNNWMDIEGVGYGWVALDDDDSKNKKTIKRLITENIKKFIGLEFTVFYKDSEYVWFFFEKENITYKYEGKRHLDICDKMVTYSNKELYFF